jgi:hypothetical protein
MHFIKKYPNEFGERFELIKNDGKSVDTSYNSIIEYTGPYYTKKSTIYDPLDLYHFIETRFIGKVARHKITNYEMNGIYIIPEYIFIDNEWHIITNYKEPEYKINFLYPHLLCLPNIYYNNCFHNLHTIENRDIKELINCKSFLI